MNFPEDTGTDITEIYRKTALFVSCVRWVNCDALCHVLSKVTYLIELTI